MSRLVHGLMPGSLLLQCGLEGGWCLREGHSYHSSPHSYASRDVIKRIDQSEFEGFEYINPLLLSAEESV